MDRGWLHCSDTCPNDPELQFVFGSQKTTRFVKFPPCASIRQRTRSRNWVTLKILMSSTMLGKPRTWGSRGGALPKVSGPGSTHAALFRYTLAFGSNEPLSPCDVNADVPV